MRGPSVNIELVGDHAAQRTAELINVADDQSREEVENLSKRYVTELKPRSGWAGVNLAELWQYRSLLMIFVWRDIKVRYKQTTLGPLWIVLQPLAMTVIYSIFFGYIARIPSGDVPYPVFVLSGIVIWQFFLRAVNEGSTSLAAYQGLIGKIYFPRLLAPLTAMTGAVLDFVIMLGILLPVMLYFGIWPGFTVLLAPFFLLALGLVALGISLFLTGLDAIFRDVRYALSFVLQIWYFTSPIIYPVELVPERFRTIYLLNPTTPLVQGFRSAILGQDSMPPMWSLAWASLMSLVILLVGLAVFQRIERNIVDRI